MFYPSFEFLLTVRNRATSIFAIFCSVLQQFGSGISVITHRSASSFIRAEAVGVSLPGDLLKTVVSGQNGGVANKRATTRYFS